MASPWCAPPATTGAGASRTRRPTPAPSPLLHRSKRLGAFGAGGVAGLVVGASGLFFLRFVPFVGRLLGEVPGVSLLTHGFPAWDQTLLGAAGHGNPLFYSALVPVALVALFYSVRRARGVLAGFALGVGAHLLARAVVPTLDVRFVPLDALWLGVNGLIAAGLGW